MELAKKFSSDHQIVCQLHKPECKLAFGYQDYNLYHLYKYPASPTMGYKHYALFNTSQGQAQGLQDHFFLAPGRIKQKYGRFTPYFSIIYADKG